VSLFSELLDAVMERREVSFDYRKLEAARAERRRVQPLHVGHLEGGWYLVAHDPARRALRTFALQRIEGLRVLKSGFKRPENFDATQYLNGGFGVWSYRDEEQKSQEVCIQFHGYAARIVSERRWHPSQEIRNVRGDGSVIELKLRVTGLEELTRWVLSWGGKAKVMAPPDLKRRVIDQARAIVATNTG
jgi:predicted DNA-binding transcriptional regulator YafY